MGHIFRSQNYNFQNQTGKNHNLYIPVLDAGEQQQYTESGHF